MASKIKENKNTPNINFIAFQKQLLGITGEIKEHNKKSPLKKMLGRNKESNHVDGSIIGSAAEGNSEVKKLVSKLNKEPTDSTSRVQLVNAVVNHSKDYHLDTHRDIMLQAAVPIYLGDITPVFVQVSIVTYKTYLEKLQNVHKQNMMAIKSSVLKNVNMSGINVNDEADDEKHINRRAVHRSRARPNDLPVLVAKNVHLLHYGSNRTWLNRSGSSERTPSPAGRRLPLRM